MKIFEIFKLDKEIIERKKKVKQLNSEVKKYSSLKKSHRDLIYKEERKKYIDSEKIIKLKGFELDLLEEKNVFNLFGFFKKKYNSVVLYIGKDSVLKPIAINETIAKTLEIFKQQKYVISDELTKKFKKIFFKGKRVFHLTPDYPINAEFDADKKKFFVDALTFNGLVNEVFDYQLTQPVKQALGIFELFKKYWILILIAIIAIIISQSEGGFSGALGL